MGKVNYHVLSDSIILNFGAKTVTIRTGDSRFDAVLNAIRTRKVDDIPGIVDTEAVFAQAGLELKNGRVLIDGDQLPDSLNDRLLKLMEEKMPVEILVNFWKNLKQNPSFNSRKMLYKFLEHNGHPLTDDGCFIAYRGVTSDFKDVHTKTFNNSVGSICEVGRDQVDDNPNNTCSHGLHVACYNYAKDFGPRLIEVKVNPKDVVTVPVDYNGTKMRVCKFEVMAVCENILSGQVYKPEEVKAKFEAKKKTHNLRGPDGKFISQKQHSVVAEEIATMDNDDDDYYSSY